MAKQYAILHIEKHTSTGGGLGNHIERTEGKEHTYPHAKPEMKKFNISYDIGYKNIPLGKAISQRIAKGYTKDSPIRKDAVKYLSLILTGTNEQVWAINKDQKMFLEWQKANYKFLVEEFGKDNIVKLELHRDEKTPHFHAIIVPLTKDGRLSAKEVVGDRKKLKLFQDKYAAAMLPFGLERGEENTENKHITTKEFYTQVEKTRKEVEKIDDRWINNLMPNQSKELIKKFLKTGKINADLESQIRQKNTGFKR